ncbi:8597_t:CDS:2, partial [Gigaspora margarita]
LSIKFKKTFKNTQSKKAKKGKMANLESTRSTSLSESFLERFDNLGVNDNKILSELKVIKDKIRRIENHLNNLEQKMDNNFDITNNKAFKE